MRCKKHLSDLSSSVGVCASCLRECLFALIAAQAQEDRRKSDTQPPPLVFPRSVSPYITRRKSDNAAWHHHHYHHQHSLSDQRFYSTPHVGPTGAIVSDSSFKKTHSRFSLFRSLFRSKSHTPDSDPRSSVSNSRDSCTASSSSPSWFSNILSGSRKKQSRPCRNRGRGMSPARYSGYAEHEECYDGSSGYSSESSQRSKQTPIRPAPPVRRGGGERSSHSRNVSGLTFCLSPLVRASPNRHWHQKGMQPEMACSGDVRVPVKPHLSTAASFCANRSRKFADFGRFNHNH